jgi:hypothetical protein
MAIHVNSSVGGGAPEKQVHIREIALAGQVHNNKMEQMKGDVRDREKVMRGLKTVDTPILKGMQIYHNFIRPLEALNGATPADRAGIIVEGPRQMEAANSERPAPAMQQGED